MKDCNLIPVQLRFHDARTNPCKSWVWVGSLRIKSGDSDRRCWHGNASLEIPPPDPKDTSTVKILALDLGKFNTMCCFFDTKTRKHSFLKAPTERDYLNTLFETHKVDLVVMEACGPSGWINDLAMSHSNKRTHHRSRCLNRAVNH